MVALDFDIVPLSLHATLFPQPEVSIEELLAFKLPPQDRNISSMHPSVFFSDNNAVAINAETTRQLRSLSIPSQPTLDALFHHLENSMTVLPTAISYAHLHVDHPLRRVNFPLWVIMYWLRISRLLHHAIVPWMRAEQWLSSSLSSLGHRELVAEARSILRDLPWTGKTWAFTDSEPLSTFAQYLSSGWLASTHIHQQLDLLRHRLLQDLPVHDFNLLPTHFFNRLVNVYKHHQHDYADTQQFREMWQRGEELGKPEFQRMRVGGVINTNGNHWVGIVINLHTSSILYGDSLALTDDIIILALSWWTHIHTKHNFVRLPLPIGIQTDGVSCGLFATSALKHHFLPDCELVGQRSVIRERLRLFCETARYEINTVSLLL